MTTGNVEKVIDRAISTAISRGLKVETRIRFPDQVVSAEILFVYAEFALQSYSLRSDCFFHLATIGPHAVGDFFGCSIIHFNFEAFDIDDPDRVFHTFFCEITQNNMDLDLDPLVSSVCCVGPTKELPEIAVDYGCVYCSSHNVHHSDVPSTFRNGRADHLLFLCRQVDLLNTFLSKCLKNKKVLCPGLVHPELEGKEFGPLVHPSRHYFVEFLPNGGLLHAHKAISLYNGKEGKNMEVIDMGIVSPVVWRFGIICHLNFKAVNKDESGAPAQTFFAEYIIGNNFLFVDCCECLGPSDSLPDEANLRGCNYCRPTIHHPQSQEYINGGELMISDWNST